MKVIPIKAQAGIVGFESPASEYKELGLSLDQLIINNPNATFIGLASGESMQGVGIFDGDILIVDRSISPKQYDVIVANYNNEFVCKIIDITNRRLLSASRIYAPVAISEADTFQLEGVVISTVRLFKKNVELAKCMR
ncbi:MULTISPECIES: S24 family peptidase [unclassified Pseudoalteromonas]|uniref:LexA family protein n=1 Tax=unclassified Pseudoalteromonas TaxID=194690 RepID=UPI00110B21B1|nr:MULTISPECIES: S24 family peptidase [unclassified Pseudoalteromonas]TMN34119.1 peptidase [Pseudoalteromonas sp. S2755]USD30899.1 S24 family peptidase [Pseudoalteromonas sp. SCSIO 43201]